MASGKQPSVCYDRHEVWMNGKLVKAYSRGNNAVTKLIELCLQSAHPEENVYELRIFESGKGYVISLRPEW